VSKAMERCPPGSMRVVCPGDADYYPSSLGGSQADLLQETFRPDTTKHGVLLLPDITGYGPIYVCVIEKKEDLAAAQLRLQMLKVVEEEEATEEGDTNEEA